jgi:hypothetical protein
VGRLLFAKVIDEFFTIALAFRKARAFGAHIGVVEAAEGCIQDIEHLEGHIGLVAGEVHRIPKPRAFEGLATERVAALPGEGVPTATAKRS